MRLKQISHAVIGLPLLSLISNLSDAIVLYCKQCHQNITKDVLFWSNSFFTSKFCAMSLESCPCLQIVHLLRSGASSVYHSFIISTHAVSSFKSLLSVYTSFRLSTDSSNGSKDTFCPVLLSGTTTSISFRILVRPSYNSPY